MNRCIGIVMSLILYLLCRYDPLSDQWTMISHLSVPKDAVGVCVLGDKLYCVGGYDGQKHLRDVESYNTAEDKWTKVCYVPLAEDI